MIEPQILAKNYKEILSILNNITKYENKTPLIDYPVLIGSQAAKWHVSSLREPNDWDLVATPLQTALFINKVNESSATFNDIQLIYYPGGGLKLIGMYIGKSTNEKPIRFDFELVSDKVDLRNKESKYKKKNENENENENKSDEDDKSSEDSYTSYDHQDEEEDDDDTKDDDMQNDDTKDGDMQNDDKFIEFKKFNNTQPKISALMIFELCHNIEDKTMLPLLLDYSCIVAPLKILEALKASHIYWPADFDKNIADLHLLRILLNYSEISDVQPLCSPQRDEPIELMLKTRIKETEIIRGIPAAHINLNMSNEEFLDDEDNLFVQRRVPHDYLHELVKYGDHPIYPSLKEDQVQY
jgi:hypothetical protein